MLAALLFLSFSSAAVCLPSYVTGLQDEKLYRQVNLSSLAPLESAIKSTPTAAQTLALIADYRANRFSSFSVKDFLSSYEAPPDLTVMQSLCLSELEDLQKRQLFPEINVHSPIRSVNVEAQTYSGLYTNVQTATIWNATLVYDPFRISVVMDSETHKIYAYSVFCEKSLNPIEYDSFLTRWSNYLNIKIEPNSQDTKFPAQESTPDYTFLRSTGIFVQNGRKYGFTLVTESSIKGFSSNLDFFPYQ